MLWLCVQCTTAYSVGAHHCPACGSEDYVEEGTDMAKIGRHLGASNATSGEGMPGRKDKAVAVDESGNVHELDFTETEVTVEVEESTVERDPDAEESTDEVPEEKPKRTRKAKDADSE